MWLMFCLHLKYGTDEAAAEKDAGREAGDEESTAASAAGGDTVDRGR